MSNRPKKSKGTKSKKPGEATESGEIRLGRTTPTPTFNSDTE